MIDLETQNLTIRSLTETALRIFYKKIQKKLFWARCFFGQAVLQKLTNILRSCHWINSLLLQLGGSVYKKTLPSIFGSYGHSVWNFILMFKPQLFSLRSGLRRTHTPLTTPLAEKSWFEKQSHDHGINSRDTIPDRIATKYREEMYYF